MADKKRLGRNLEALLGRPAPMLEKEPSPISDQQLKLPVEYLKSGQYQPRKTMAKEALKELAASIKAQGVIQPIIVRPIGACSYEILAGERRWRAAQLAGLNAVPVIIRDVDDSSAIAIALIENIQREDLNPIEEAQALERLIKEFSLTHQQVADAVGRSRTAVTNLLRLLHLADEVKVMLESGEIEMGHARALLTLDAMKQLELAKRIVTLKMTVRETEAAIAKIQRPLVTRLKREDTLSDPFLQLQTDLSKVLASKVELQPGRKGGGKLLITYRDRVTLEAIVHRIKSLTTT